MPGLDVVPFGVGPLRGGHRGGSGHGQVLLDGAVPLDGIEVAAGLHLEDGPLVEGIGDVLGRQHLHGLVGRRAHVGLDGLGLEVAPDGVEFGLRGAPRRRVRLLRRPRPGRPPGGPPRPVRPGWRRWPVGRPARR